MISTPTPAEVIPAASGKMLAQQEVVAQAERAVAALDKEDPTALAGLMSQELVSTFGVDSIQQALAQQERVQYELVGMPVVDGHWATQDVRVSLDGYTPNTRRFFIMNLGNGYYTARLGCSCFPFR